MKPRKLLDGYGRLGLHLAAPNPKPIYSGLKERKADFSHVTEFTRSRWSLLSQEQLADVRTGSLILSVLFLACRVWLQCERCNSRQRARIWTVRRKEGDARHIRSSLSGEEMLCHEPSGQTATCVTLGSTGAHTAPPSNRVG